MGEKKKEPVVIKKSQAIELYEKQKRRVRRRIILLIVIGALILLSIFTWRKAYPVYKETQENVYDILADMDESSFMRSGNTIIYDADGEVIGRIGNEKYEYVESKEISDYITKGYIAKEDKEFTTHNGIDIKAIIRAGISYVKNKGEITQGGSTITQQVIKNNLLSQEQTFSRKFTEILLAIQMEKDYTKAEIMEFYCNSNYYGNGCYGVEGASLYYFGKDASEVTLAEAAVLVATSNSPNNYNPVADYDLAMEKKVEVLDEMLECGYITQEEYDTAAAEEPEIVQQSENVDNENYLVSYAIHCAALKVMENDGFDFQYTFESSEEYEEYSVNYSTTYNDAVEAVRTGGYSIYTSLDQKVQEKLQESIDSNLAEFTDKTDDIYDMQAAAVCIDNETQMVVAIVGGREEEGEYNRGYQATRQPGSSIKPILDYAPAMEEGLVTPGTVLTDEATTVNGYTPKNAGGGYSGEVTVRDALVKSINTIALQLYDMTGAETALSYLDALHYSTLAYADMSAAAVSLGGFTDGVTVSDMARAYATLANGGEYTENDCILTLIDYTGETVYEASEETTEVYTADTAFMVTDILEGTFEEEFGNGSDKDTKGQHYAAKTGTTNENYDAWLCGYSSYYTTAVWVGYDYPKDLEFSGSSYPMDIWYDFMDTMHTDLDPQEFEVPDTVGLRSQSGKTMNVTYKTNIYSSRPGGYDYYSKTVEKKLKKAEEEREEQKLEEEAEAAVAEFEDYQITDVESAQGFDDLYQDTYELASSVKDADVRSGLLTRLEYKYNLLSAEVMDAWADAIEAAEIAAQEEKDLANEKAAQESLEEAAEAEKESRISTVESYIESLNACSYYTEYVEFIISSAENALEECTEYSEYSTLKKELSSAAATARALPEYGNTGRTNISGEVEEDDSSSSDNSSNSNNNSSNSNTSSNRTEIIVGD